MSIVWDERGGATVVRDGHPQSYVDPDDPLLLVFEYVQQFALVLESLRPAVCILLGMLAARGESVLRDVYVINRGYEDLANRLNALGANIEVFRD